MKPSAKEEKFRTYLKQAKLESLLNLVDGPEFIWSADQLTYKGPEVESRKMTPMHFDLVKEWEYQKKTFNHLRSSPLAKSLGAKGEKLKLWDMTGGTGKDSLCFLALGHTVTTWERNPVSFCLLLSGFMDLYQFVPEVEARHVLVFGPAHESSKESADLIFVDPMYPEQGQSKALPKKEMQVFRELVGADLDWEELLEFSISHARKRTVLKRSKSASKVGNPNHCVEGKSTRYDIYLPN